MKKCTTEGRPDRRWLPSGVLIALALVGAGVLLNRDTPQIPGIPAPVRIESTSWRAGVEVELTVHTTPPRAGELVTLTLLAPGTDQPQPAEVEGDRANSFFGLSGVQLLWLSPEHREIEVALAAATGASTIGLDFDWRRIEPEPGQHVWADTDDVVALAKRYGLHLVPMLLYTPRWASTAPFAPLDYQRAPPADLNAYRDFVYAVVSRYEPYGISPLTADGFGITDWVMWNEPNVSTHRRAPQPGDFWAGSLEEYLGLLRAGYEGAHAADPGCNVLNGALADVFWKENELDLITAMERFYDPDGNGDPADGGRPFFDTLNIHTYQVGEPDAAWYEERLERVLRVMERFGDEQKSIWITETGYGSLHAPGSPHSSADETSEKISYVNEETQASAVHLVYETCSVYAQVERVFWWSLRDYYTDASATNTAMEAHYGLLRANFAPKPAYLAYARLTGSVDQVLTLTVVTDADGIVHVTIPSSFVTHQGTYIVFAALDETVQSGVASYNILPGAGKGQD